MCKNQNIKALFEPNLKTKDNSHLGERKDTRGKVMTSIQDGHSDEFLSFKSVQSVFLDEDFPNLTPVVSVHSGERSSLTLYVLHCLVLINTHKLAKRRKGT